MLSEKLNMTWDEITQKNYFWFKHKVDFFNFTVREENKKIKIAEMRHKR